jgi:hypothetical protein
MPIPDGFAQINYMLTGQGAPTGAQLVFGVDVTIFSGTVADLANNAWDNWVAEMTPELPNSISLSGVLAKMGPDATGPSFLRTGSSTGPSSGAVASPQVAYLFNKHTDLGGRSGKGRSYMPGVLEANVDASGNVGGPTVGAWNNALTAFLALFDGDDTPLVLLHAADAPITSPTIITGMTCQTRVATQRRRLRR